MMASLLGSKVEEKQHEPEKPIDREKVTHSFNDSVTIVLMIVCICGLEFVKTSGICMIIISYILFIRHVCNCYRSQQTYMADLQSLAQKPEAV